MEVAHFYHAWCDGPVWQGIIQEHFSALIDAEWVGPIAVGLVGDVASQNLAEGLIRDSGLPDLNFARFHGGQWEQATISLLHAYATANPADAVLYAHTKGAADPTPFNARWRRSMTRQLIANWDWCLEALASPAQDYDAIGSHWLYPSDYPHFRQYFDSDDEGFFGGNFWMATTNYLARLPRCSNADRHKAERWIGLGKPRVYDLLEGWPADAVFDRGTQRESPAIPR